MKKCVLFLIVAFIGSQMMTGQVMSCYPYSSTRTLEQFKRIISSGTDSFVKNELWPAYIEIINESLEEKGFDPIPLTQEGIQFILDHTVEYGQSEFIQADYLNGVKVDGMLEFRPIAGNPSPWAVFVFENVVCMYSKIKCCNPQKIKQKKFTLTRTPTPEPTPEPEPTPTPPTFVPEKRTERSVVTRNDDYSHVYERQDYSIRRKKPQFVEKKNINFLGLVIPVGVIVAGVIYFLLNKQKDNNSNYHNNDNPYVPPVVPGVPGGTPTS